MSVDTVNKLGSGGKNLRRRRTARLHAAWARRTRDGANLDTIRIMIPTMMASPTGGAADRAQCAGRNGAAPACCRVIPCQAARSTPRAAAGSLLVDPSKMPRVSFSSMSISGFERNPLRGDFGM